MLKDYFDKLYTKSQEEFFSEMDECLRTGGKRFVVTANPETLMIARKTPDFDRVLCSEKTTITPDGIGVVKAAESLGLEMHGRVTGVELAAHLIEQCRKTGKRVYLFGAKEEVVSTLAERVRADGTEAALAGYTNGYVSDPDAVFDEIRALAPDVVLVALGIPKQELLIDRHYDSFEKGIFVGVGGSFDVLSGMKRRAPRLFVRLNLEWLWRILREPSRFGRFYESNVRFFSEVGKIKKQK